MSSLNHATFTGAQLKNANLSGAELMGANFNGARLAGTKFAQQISDPELWAPVAATLGNTALGNVDLSQTNGLEYLKHKGPSSLGIDTIYLSQGRIPEVFLRGCGVPDNFIAYSKSLVTNPVEFYSCFISYSTKDQAFAGRLYADLQSQGVRCWFAPHDAQRGRKLHEQIDEAIRLHEKLLLILSSHSMNSEWVKTEISKARRREMQEKIQVLFPVSVVPYDQIRDWECFDADTGKDSAREIREYLIGDFQNWKDHDTYRAEFDKLLRDLRSRKSAPASV